jgi:hypothetical protein
MLGRFHKLQACEVRGSRQVKREMINQHISNHVRGQLSPPLIGVQILLSCILYLTTLVGRFKFFSTIYGEKCCLFFRHFSLKKVVKNSKNFHHFVSSR